MQGLMSLTTVTLTRAEFSTTATVYLQKNAPLKMLLGTDVLESLGIQVSLTTGDEVQNLLSKKEVAPELIVPCSADLAGDQQLRVADDPHQEHCPLTSSTRELLSRSGEHLGSRVVEVRLLTAVKLSARHEKLVRARVDDC